MNTGLIAIFILLIIIVGAIATRRCVEFLIGGSLLAAIFMYGKGFSAAVVYADPGCAC